MKDNARTLKRRLKSVQSIGQMTRAMKTVSLSKYNRALSRLSGIRAYSEQCQRLLALCGNQEEKREQNPVLYVLLTANRGLCGAYNLAMWDYAQQVLAAEQQPYSLVICGQWGIDRAKEKHTPHIEKTFVFHDIPTLEEGAELADYLSEAWASNCYSSIYILLQEFHNILTQVPGKTLLMPLQGLQGTDQDILFLPGREDVMRVVSQKCMQAQVYEKLLASAAGAQGASLMAMRTASDNAQEMASVLERNLNRLRQSAVTTQVLEIARGN